MPFKPNTYAKRGTAFHQWLEDRFGATALLDEEQLPGIDEEPVDAQQLEELKDAFLESEWAERTPAYVEQPFEVRIGDGSRGWRSMRRSTGSSSPPPPTSARARCWSS